MLSTQKETGFNPGYRPVIELEVKSWGVDRPSQGMYRHVSRGCHLVSTGGMGREGDLGSGLAHGSFVRWSLVSSPSLRPLNSPKLASLRSGGSEGRRACPPPGELTIWQVQQASKAQSECVCPVSRHRKQQLRVSHGPHWKVEVGRQPHASKTFLPKSHRDDSVIKSHRVLLGVSPVQNHGVLGTSRLSNTVY